MGSLADFAPPNRQETAGKFEQKGKREHFSLFTSKVNNDCKGLPNLDANLEAESHRFGRRSILVATRRQGLEHDDDAKCRRFATRA